jgi:hypothetical protein
MNFFSKKKIAINSELVEELGNYDKNIFKIYEKMVVSPEIIYADVDFVCCIRDTFQKSSESLELIRNLFLRKKRRQLT